MVEEVQREIDAELQKLTQALQQILNVVSEKESDPMRKKLAKEVSKLPSADRREITFSPDLEERLEQYCTEHKIPHAMIRQGMVRNMGNSSVIVSKEDEEEVYQALRDLEKSNPLYYRDSDAENFVWNASMTGAKEFVSIPFPSREDAERFRNKLYQSGHGVISHITMDKNNGYVLLVNGKDFLTAGNRMDVLTAMTETAINKAIPLKECVQKAQVMWDRTEEESFVLKVLTSIRQTKEAVYLVDQDNPKEKLVYRPGMGIYRESEKEKAKLLVREQYLDKIKDDVGDKLSLTIDSIRQSISSGLDSIHDMKTMSQEEYQSFTVNPDAKKEQNKRLAQWMHSQIKTGKTLSAMELLSQTTGRPSLNQKRILEYVKKANELGKRTSPLYQEFYDGTNFQHAFQATEKRWMLEHYPNQKTMKVNEVLQARMEFLHSEELDALVGKFSNGSTKTVENAMDEIRNTIGRVHVLNHTAAMQLGKDGDERMYRVMQAELERTVDKDKEEERD